MSLGFQMIVSGFAFVTQNHVTGATEQFTAILINLGSFVLLCTFSSTQH